MQQVTASYGLTRADVGTAFGSSQFDPCGYSALLTLSPGAYRLEVTSNETAGALETVVVPVTVVESHPATSVDVPANTATVTAPFQIGGWAIDTGAPAGTGVDAIHVWAFKNGDPNQAIWLGAATLGGSRPDVGAVYGAAFTPSGFNLWPTLPSGAYQLSVYTHSTVTNSFVSIVVVWITVP